MKLTKSQLKEMIREELLKEDDFASKYADQLTDIKDIVMQRSHNIVKMLNQQDKITGTKNAKVYNKLIDKHFRKFILTAYKIKNTINDQIMATNKDLLEKLDTIQEKVCNQDIEQIKGDLKEIKEILLDPEDGLVVRINKNTFWRKTLTEGETNFDVIKDDVRELNNFKNNVTKAMWIIYTAVSGLIIKLIWGD